MTLKEALEQTVPNDPEFLEWVIEMAGYANISSEETDKATIIDFLIELGSALYDE